MALFVLFLLLIIIGMVIDYRRDLAQRSPGFGKQSPAAVSVIHVASLLLCYIACSWSRYPKPAMLLIDFVLICCFRGRQG